MFEIDDKAKDGATILLLSVEDGEIWDAAIGRYNGRGFSTWSWDTFEPSHYLPLNYVANASKLIPSSD